MNSFHWTCPFCGRPTTINEGGWKVDTFNFDLNNKYGDQVVRSTAVVCPNFACREFTLDVQVGAWKSGQFKQRLLFPLIPQASVKVFPDYVPGVILEDYEEACLTRKNSPKASATLSRRCLQGMIRDFWKVSKSRLIDEIEAIKDKVDPVTWSAIDAVRSIGNIGAHMERDINVIVDVDENEAELLVGLIETLIAEWYVARHERGKRMSAIVDAAASKKAIKAAKNA